MNALVAALDDALAQAGQDVILRRVVGQGASTINVDVTVRAHVETYRLREETIVGGVVQAVLLVTFSPTPILEKQWPGGTVPGVPPFDPPAWHPRVNDKLIIDGRLRNIDAVEIRTIGDDVVRINTQVLG